MGLLRRKRSNPTPVEPAAPPVDPAVLDQLRAAAADATAAAERAGTLAEAAQRQALLATETARAVGDTTPPTVTAEQFIALTAEVEKLAALVRTSIAESREARDLVATLDGRITQLGVELANQIDELSGDVDTLTSRDAADPVVAETVADLKSGQVRLAQEQARYQIAFRQDLAAIADEVRKRPQR